MWPRSQGRNTIAVPVQTFYNTGDQQEMVVCQGDVAHKSILILFEKH